MEHVFSCENVKFKRDFIQKTSNPPLIFTDLLELANNSNEGRTITGLYHDGSTHVLPTNKELHFLIAGTECKDFSSLSSSRKGIHDRHGGKSASTFWATHKLAQQLQPYIILLENVSQCPALQMNTAFMNIGYTPVHTKVCTSNYYLPQSRCRTYFIFLNNNKMKFREGLTCDDWIVEMERLKMKENDEIVSWTRYLGIDNDDNDDDTTEEKNEMMMTQHPSKKKGGGGRRGKPLAESLDSKWLAEITAIETKEGLTPYNAKEGGGRPYSDITKDVEAIASLPDRAKMRLDVQYKRAVKAGIDPMKSHLIWNPAQQLRYTHSGISFDNGNENDDDDDDDDGGGSNNNNTKATPRLITPCVTPKHEWIISSRMGPLTGVEALALQGICNNEHHQNVLSKEVLSQFTCEQLRDLAGNAMSTTVVAAVF